MYSIPKDVPVWLPSGDEDLPWFENFLQMNRVHMIIRSVEIMFSRKINYFSHYSSDKQNKDDGDSFDSTD
jgi:hypothetical protein